MISRSSRYMVCNPITCYSVIHSVWTTRGMKRPSRIKSISSVRLVERGLDCPLESFAFDSMRDAITDLVASAPDKTVTFRDLVRSRLAGQFVTGTPEQIADTLQEWFEAGVDGFNPTASFNSLSNVLVL